MISRVDVFNFLPASSDNSTRKPKYQIVAFFLCLFLGPLGAHRWYLGRYTGAVIFACTFGFLGIGVIYDLLNLSMGLMSDSTGAPLNGDEDSFLLSIATLTAVAFAFGIMTFWLTRVL